MSISGSGTGTPGGIPEFSLLSDQNSAASLNRAAMGMVKNLDTMIFTEVGKGALWKYDTSSSRPTLHPLEHMRIDASPSRIDESWKELLQDLIDNLPNEVRVAYERNLSLPFEERNSSLMTLGLLLEGTAKILNWIDNSAFILDPTNPTAGPESEIAARRELNASLVKDVMKEIINESNKHFQALRDELLAIGTNNPHYDSLSGTLNQIGMAYSTLYALQNAE